MDLKTALTKLKTAKGALPFFFCEADAKGKPVVLVGPVTEDAKTKALAGAKSKKTATGKLSINADGDLEAKAKGSALSVLSKGLTTAALNAGARGLFKNLVLGEAPAKDEESGETQSEQAPKSTTGKSAKPSVPAKKFPDVLRKDPAMAALLDQREVLRAQFAEAHKQPGTTKESLKAIAQQIQAIEASLTEAQKKLNATGFTPQPMDAHYEGEDKKMGWNADSLRPGPFVPDPNWTEEQLLQAQKVHADTVKRAELFANSDVSLRKNYSDAERANAAMSVDANGNIVDAQGKRVQTKKDSEYVMDAKEGTMHQFSFVPEAGKVVDAPHLPGMKVRQVLRTHHSSVLKGEAVGGAGGMEINDGKLAYIDNASGHYKLGVGPLVQTVETLLKQGALLDKQWVDKDGQPLSGKLADLLMGVVKLHRSLSAKAQADPTADLGKECEKINKAMAMLKKLGAGPSNRIRKDAKVGFLDIKEGMTGIEVKMAKAGVKPNAISAAEFLQTGGGNKKAAEAKTSVHEELLEKQKLRPGKRSMRSLKHALNEKVRRAVRMRPIPPRRTSTNRSPPSMNRARQVCKHMEVTLQPRKPTRLRTLHKLPRHRSPKRDTPRKAPWRKITRTWTMKGRSATMTLMTNQTKRSRRNPQRPRRKEPRRAVTPRET